MYGGRKEMEDFIMRDFVEYVMIILGTGTDLEELENHLSMNGYDFGMDKKRNLLFVNVEEIDYVESIMLDRDIDYSVREC